MVIWLFVFTYLFSSAFFFTIKGLGSLLIIVAFSRLLLSIVAKLVTLLVTPFFKIGYTSTRNCEVFQSIPSKN